MPRTKESSTLSDRQSELQRLGYTPTQAAFKVQEEQLAALAADRDALREVVAHTLYCYGERMPSQWKAHARAALERPE